MATSNQALLFYGQIKVQLIKTLFKYCDKFEDYRTIENPAFTHQSHQLVSQDPSNFNPLRIAAIKEASVAGQILVH
ncbi:hypothetical protein AAF712_016763 [Marasmius tenuissimus]|uniref:Uncharacterized protein n=1 Tax=Marasmius tenuissimus TaxID=585030 RepID=A0ABR2Z524_9AGAR